MNQLIDIVHEEIDRISSMADIAGIEFSIFCSKTKLDAKVLPVKPLVDVVVWKVVEEFPNYMVSNKGEVMKTATNIILKGGIDTSGYRSVSLTMNKVQKTYNVHKLVARMHIENPFRHACVDHIDHCRTNNVASNLRWCSHSQNGMNASKRSKPSTSSYKGVHWRKDTQKWRASVRLDGKLKHLGHFTSEVQAAVAYNNYAIIHFKEFACLNVIPPENVIDI
jgi:hypothetical protein